MSAAARAYTPLRDLALPTRPKTAAQILTEASQRAAAAGDLVAAYKLRLEADKARLAHLRSLQ